MIILFSIIGIFYLFNSEGIENKNNSNNSYNSEQLQCGTYKNITIRGDSMSPSLSSGEEIGYIESYYDCHDVLKGDIIIFYSPRDDSLLVKRVYGVEGDSLNYDDFRNTIQINEKIITNSQGEEFRIDSTILELYSSKFKVIPSQSYLVFGDEISGSYDSSKFGFIPRDIIVGKVELDE